MSTTSVAAAATAASRASALEAPDHAAALYGLFHEIVAWKLRMFVPTDANGVELLAKLMERYHLQRVADREVA